MLPQITVPTTYYLEPTTYLPPTTYNLPMVTDMAAHVMPTILPLGKLPLSRTGAKFEQLTFKCNICFNSTHRTSRSQSTHSQVPYEWFGHDLQVLLVKLEQRLHLKVDCSDFGPVRDRGSLPYTNLRKIEGVGDSRVQFVMQWPSTDMWNPPAGLKTISDSISAATNNHAITLSQVPCLSHCRP